MAFTRYGNSLCTSSGSDSALDVGRRLLVVPSMDVDLDLLVFLLRDLVVDLDLLLRLIDLGLDLCLDLVLDLLSLALSFSLSLNVVPIACLRATVRYLLFLLWKLLLWPAVTFNS